MENTPNNVTEYSSGDNKKVVLLSIVVGVIVLSALIWWMKRLPTLQQVGVSPTPTPDAESVTINQEVDSINVGDLNAELDAIDKDLQGL